MLIMYCSRPTCALYKENKKVHRAYSKFLYILRNIQNFEIYALAIDNF